MCLCGAVGLLVSFSFEVLRPGGCFCDASFVYLFPGPAKKRMKRLKCAFRAPRRPQAWGKSVPKNKEVWLRLDAGCGTPIPTTSQYF